MPSNQSSNYKDIKTSTILHLMRPHASPPRGDWTPLSLQDRFEDAEDFHLGPEAREAHRGALRRGDGDDGGELYADGGRSGGTAA